MGAFVFKIKNKLNQILAGILMVKINDGRVFNDHKIIMGHGSNVQVTIASFLSSCKDLFT